MRAIDALVCCAIFALLAACGAQPEAQKVPVETPAPVEVTSLQDFGGIGGDFALVLQVERRPGGAESTRAQRHHQRPGGGQNRAIEAGLRCRRGVLRAAFDAGNDQDGPPSA